MAAVTGINENAVAPLISRAGSFAVGSARQNYVSSSPSRIAFYESDAVSQPGFANPLILIHGLCSMSYTWHECFDQLAAHRRTIALDLKGFGASDKPADGDYLLETQAGIVISLMDSLGLSRAALAGNSLGGAVALCVAERWPQRVTDLILASPAVCGFDQFSLLARFVLAANRKVSESVALGAINRLARVPGFIASRIRHAHRHAATVTPERVGAYSAMLSDPQCQRAVIATLRTLDLKIVERELSSVHHRTLILQGVYDRIVPPSTVELLARRLPHAEVRMLPCGHAPQEEMPAEFARLVNEFLAAESSPRIRLAMN
jgi:pimeloyl-ACP methyl ester carboxylesterase